MRGFARAFSALLIGMFTFASAPARGDEGMWTFDHFPAALMRASLGWAPDQAWLDRVMAGTARMPGCSASNVSRQGLVLTNHHCVIGCIQSLSTPDTDYVEAGFMARTPDEERRCPGVAVQVLNRITDVTIRIATATQGVTPDAFAHARDAEIARIESECSSGDERCEVVTLYQGGRYALYRFKRYDDVRLVFAPEHQMAAFGGDPDNFNFPRYDADFSFVRLYENDAPAATPAHLSMRFTPLQDNEVVLIAGNPGSTQRLKSVAELSFQRDTVLPWQIETLTATRDRYMSFGAQNPENARLAASALQSVENSLKVAIGRHDALVDPAGFVRVTAREQDLQARVHRNVAAQRDVGAAWTQIAHAEAAYRAMFYAHQYLELRAGERSDLFAWARDIVRGVVERDKPDAERLPRYSQARLPAIQQSLRAQRPVSPAFEALNLEIWLTNLRHYLPTNSAAARRLFAGRTPQALAQSLAQSQLGDPAVRQQLWDGGAVAVAASADPMIAFVRGLDPDARAVRARFETLVDGPAARAQERIAQARFRAFGESQYPDATFSPRLSFGRVTGWREADGHDVAPFTTIGGLYLRATGAAPYVLTQRWIDARSKLDPSIIFDVSTSTDVVGGNSGSPLLDRDGRVVGAVFDGNIHSLGGDFFYDGAVNRSVTVSSAAIGAVLRSVYSMDGLLAELQAN